MAKDKTVYVCSNCGQDSPKWIGKCPSCGEWNTYVEEIVHKEAANKRPVSGIETPKAKPISLCDITTSDEPRIDLKDEELNRVLGGGLVPGSLVLIGGEPGIGNLPWYCKQFFGCLIAVFFMSPAKKAHAS
jgi:Predicted ATP-dependent serine protease